MEKSIEILIRGRPVMMQVHVVERWNVFRVRTSTARSRGPKRYAVTGSRCGQSGIMHRVMIVPVCLRRLLLSPGQSAVQADGRAVLPLVVRAAIVRGCATRRVHGLVPSTVGMAPQVKRTGSGLVMRAGEAGTPVRVGVDRERRAGHVEAGSI